MELKTNRARLRLYIHAVHTYTYIYRHTNMYIQYILCLMKTVLFVDIVILKMTQWDTVSVPN